MSIKEVLPKFESLKASVLSDGNIDIDEVNALIDFIKPYCMTYNKRFIALLRILMIAKDDGKITELETRAIVDALDDVSKFLKTERRIEIVMSIAAVVSLVALGVYFFLR